MYKLKSKRLKREMQAALITDGIKRSEMSEWGDQRLIHEFADHIVASSFQAMPGSILGEYNLYDVIRTSMLDKLCDKL